MRIPHTSTASKIHFGTRFEDYPTKSPSDVEIHAAAIVFNMTPEALKKQASIEGAVPLTGWVSAAKGDDWDKALEQAIISQEKLKGFENPKQERKAHKKAKTHRRVSRLLDQMA